jgi:N-acetylglutamate synthase-like GNAT family acetyltransferase
VAALELEARVLGCRAVYLLTTDTSLFARLGYRPCEITEVPAAIASSFAQRCPASVAMVKHIS